MSPMRLFVLGAVKSLVKFLLLGLIVYGGAAGLVWVTSQFVDARWAAVLFVVLVFLAGVVLRAAIYFRPEIAVWLAAKTLGASSTLRASGLPARLVLQPLGTATFRNPAVVEQTVADLATQGFVEVGRYLTNLSGSVPIVLMANPQHALRVLLFEAENGRLVAEFATEYAGERYVCFSNCAEYGLDQRPGTESIRDCHATPLQVLTRCLAERPREDIVPVGPETAVGAFERESTLSLAWRQERGFTPREIGVIWGKLITGALSAVVVGSAVLFLVAALVAAVCYRLRDSLPLSALVPLIVVVMLLPFLGLVPLLRWSGVLPNFRNRRRLPCATGAGEREGGGQVRPAPELPLGAPPAYATSPTGSSLPEEKRRSTWELVLGCWPFLLVPWVVLICLQDNGYVEGTVFESEWIGRIFWGLFLIAFVILPWLRHLYEIARIKAKEGRSPPEPDTGSAAPK